MNLKGAIIAILSVLIIFLVSIFSYYYKDEIYDWYSKTFMDKPLVIERNNYYKDKDYNFVQNTDDFYAKDKNHLINIFYTIINSGTNKFTFYCDKEYRQCLNDVHSVSKNKTLLSNINNFVHPFNSFSKIYVNYNTKGVVNIELEKNYSEDEKIKLNEKVDEVIKNELNDKMDTRTKIRKIHDYIINNSNYATENVTNIHNKATGNLLEAKGLCGGYTDSMALFLEKLGINNYKIASDNHVWNMVNLNNKWYHLDLTWDDPIGGEDRLDILFFLITDKRLKELDKTQHEYDASIYSEILAK